MFNCNLCENNFGSRVDFMMHKKKMHKEFVPDCEKFSLGKCIRGSSECWFVHKNTEKDTEHSTSNDSVFHSSIRKSILPENMNKMVDLMEKLQLTMQMLTETLKK